MLLVKKTTKLNAENKADKQLEVHLMNIFAICVFNADKKILGRQQSAKKKRRNI